jgi:hypothetical protein
MYFNNPDSLSSSVYSIDVLDINGNKINVSGTSQPMYIVIESTKINNNSLCKYFDYSQNNWITINITKIVIGKYIICSSKIII